MENIPATMFTALGLDPAAEVRDPLNRPLPISRGEAVMELFRVTSNDQSIRAS
jgi:hypothetical protein